LREAAERNYVSSGLARRAPDKMNIPGFKFHALKGKDKGRCSVWVTGNYRITFEWSDADAIDLDLEDYH
jgi:toxin HigB-1